MKYSVDSDNTMQVKRVMHGDDSCVSPSVKVMTDNFIRRYDAGDDLRTIFNETVTYLWERAADMIYFFRTITLREIMISYSVVPEFRPVVKVYSGIVRDAREMKWIEA